MVLRPSHAGELGRFAAVAVLALATAPPTASAQSFFQFLTPDPPYSQVQANLSRYGYTLRSGVAHRGDTYVLDARDRQGMMERLVIDANSGRIMQRYALAEPTWQSPQRTAPTEGWSWRLPQTERSGGTPRLAVG